MHLNLEFPPFFHVTKGISKKGLVLMYRHCDDAADQATKKNGKDTALHAAVKLPHKLRQKQPSRLGYGEQLIEPLRQALHPVQTRNS